MTPNEAAKILHPIILINEKFEDIQKRKIEYFKFDLNINMTLNHVSRNHHQVTAKNKKENTFIAELDCEGKRKFYDKVWIEIFYFLKNNIDPIDNLPAAMKPILDGMVNVGVIKDDSIDIIQSPQINWFIKFKNEKGKRKINNFVMILIAEKPLFKGEFKEV